MSRSAVSQPNPTLISLLTLRNAHLVAELECAFEVRRHRGRKSHRGPILDEVVDRLCGLMGLSLPHGFDRSELTPVLSPDLVRRVVSDEECAGWDNLMRGMEERARPLITELVRHEYVDDNFAQRMTPEREPERTTRTEVLDRLSRHFPNRYGMYPVPPLLSPESKLLDQLRMEPGMIKEMMQRCEQDLLGTYHYEYDKKGRLRSVITLYFNRIALCAEELKVSAFDLALVVFVHELAHLLSHRGLDFAGQQWDTDAFRDASTYTKEGIAQWFTEQYFDRLPERDAFYELLSGQSAPYKIHANWRFLRAAQESVRMAMIEHRVAIYPYDGSRSHNDAFHQRVLACSKRFDP